MEKKTEVGKSGGGRGDAFRFSPRPNRAHEINWLPWGDEALRRAEEEGKPVLLSISAVWCHWCHVMDETSYSDPAVIELVNRNFIPVRVDSDRNPDINRRYNQGGWPTTAFLSPAGALLAGATYIPPETMRVALERISEMYRRHRLELAEPAVADPLPAGQGDGPSLREVEEAGALILRAWDRAYGGLGREPKFPQTEALALALDLYADEGMDEYLLFARTSLEAMIRGNLLDKVEGGFFRYSTTRDWSVPHYEKMLADNAGLLPVLIRAYGLTGAQVFRRTAAETAAYVQRTLSDGVCRLYGSQDADEEYYLLTAEERKGRAAPPVDATVYTDLAARAAVGLLVAGNALGREDHATLALAALEFLWSESFRAEEGMAHYHDGGPHRWGLLDDGVEAAAAFTRAYGLTGDRRHLERAEALLRLVVDLHWDERRSLLLDTAPGMTLPGLQPEPADPGSLARAAEAMLYYWASTGEEEWRRRAGLILSASSGTAAANGALAAPYATAVNLYLRGPLLVRIGASSPAEARAFLRLSLLSPRPRLFPIVDGKVGRIKGGTQVEVCSMEACHLQSTELETLAAHLGVREELMKGVRDDERGLPG